ncbi:MAG TPA: F0F1 ATP synthase subunit A [Kineosporiaceae bacterium]|nr:F0F1 ATP synthase subunit A [Kineosporiaceae bacterium]
MLAAGSGFEAPSTADFWQPLFGTDGPFAITRASIVILLSAVVIIGLLLLGTRRLAVVPTKGQYLTEQVYGMVRNGLGRDIIGSHDFLKFVPLLFSMFVLILVNNLFGIIPLVQFPTMSRIGFPVGLALVVFVIYHLVGIRAKGLGGHFKHMIPPGLPLPVLLLIVPLELLTYFFTRPVTLALRLFGNMFAGHLLLVLFAAGGEYLILHSNVPGYVPVGAFSYVMAFVMTVFEILVEFLQAYIFTLLAALYIAGSLADEH